MFIWKKMCQNVFAWKNFTFNLTVFEENIKKNTITNTDIASEPKSSQPRHFDSVFLSCEVYLWIKGKYYLVLF